MVGRGVALSTTRESAEKYVFRKTNTQFRILTLVDTCLMCTKGGRLKIGLADRTPRETLEERLEKTLSSARCFAQGSSLIPGMLNNPRKSYGHHTWYRGAIRPVLLTMGLPARPDTGAAAY